MSSLDKKPRFVYGGVRSTEQKEVEVVMVGAKGSTEDQYKGRVQKRREDQIGEN